jgi:hypothetical protein
VGRRRARVAAIVRVDVPADAPDAVFARVVAALRDEPGVAEGTGFGANPGLRAGKSIFAMLVRDALVVKLPADRCAALVASGEAEPFVVGRRAMREWASVAAADEARWLALAREAHAFVAG